LKTSGSVIKAEALKCHLPILQPERLNDPALIGTLKDYHADCFVIVGFRILPVEIIELPPRGTINLHASLLPKYRGAAPIQWALIRGEKETGVSVFFVEKKVDAGEIILQKTVAIRENEDAGQLHDRLAEIGADAISEAVDLIASGNVRRIPQTGVYTSAPKILPEHCLIDWNQSPDQIVNLIRGLSPFPGAFTWMHGERLKIFKAKAVGNDSKKPGLPGEIVAIQKDGLFVSAKTGNVQILELQLEGKRRMDIGAFIRGYSFSKGLILGGSSE
jgi:methionyl-tRNA formyltransferase